MMKKRNTGKQPEESQVTMTELVFPNDTNPLGILRGGRIMDWMDTASAICAQTHANTIAVSASVDRVVFRRPVRLGDILTVKAKITRAFRSSMEIFVEVTARRIPKGEVFVSNIAYFNFVALDKDAKPMEVPPVIPVTAEDNRHYEEALERYNMRKS